MKCFEKNNVPPGYTPVEGSKCHATEAECAKECGPCWRCYKKQTLEVCDSQNIAVLAQVKGINSSTTDILDTTDETGIPGGTIPVIGVIEESATCIFSFQYKSPVRVQCGPKFTASTLSLSVYANINGSIQLGIITDAIAFEDGRINDCAQIRMLTETALVLGENNLTIPVYRTESSSDQVGNIEVEINVIDMSVDEPDIPNDAYEYQCFDAQPTEDGWIATGDCHATEEECAKECGPWKCYRKSYLPPKCNIPGSGKEIMPINIQAAFSDCVAKAFLPEDSPYEEDVARSINSIILNVDRSKGNGSAGWNFQCDLITPTNPPTTNTCVPNFVQGTPATTTDASFINRGEYAPGSQSYCEWAFIAPVVSLGSQQSTYASFFLGMPSQEMQFRLYGPRVPLDEDGFGYIMVFDLSDVTIGEPFEIIRELKPAADEGISGNFVDVLIKDSSGIVLSTGRFSIEGKLTVTGEALEVTDNPDLPPMVGDKYQCFDAQPDEDGWIATGGGHPDEASCAEECPPKPCPDACEPGTGGYYWGQNSGYIIEEQIRNRALETFLIGQPLPGFKMTGTDWFDENGNYPVPLTSLIVSAVRPPSISQNQGFVETAALYDGNSAMGDDTKSKIERTLAGECASAYATITLRIGKDYGIWIDILVHRFGPKIVIQPKYNSHQVFGSYFTKIGFGGLTFSPVPWGGAGPWEYVIAAESLCDETTTPDKEKQVFRVPNNQWGGVLSIELFRERFDPEDGNPYLVSIEYPDLFTIRNCDPCTPDLGARTMTTTKTTGGPGTHLKNLLAWFNIKAKEKGCGCRSLQKKMDRNGPQWCRDNREQILDHLAAEAKKRRLPFIRLAAEKLLELAIRRSEK